MKLITINHDSPGWERITHNGKPTPIMWYNDGLSGDEAVNRRIERMLSVSYVLLGHREMPDFAPHQYITPNDEGGWNAVRVVAQ